MPFEAKFFVAGVPQQKGSKIPAIMWVGGKPKPYLRDANRKYVPWEAAIAAAALDHRPPEPMTCGFYLDVLFVFERPKSVDELERPNHTVFPDRDKLLRCVQDALSKIIWKDDAQVCAGPTEKVYGGPPGAHIHIKALGGAVQETLF